MNDALLNVMNQSKHKDWDIPDVVDRYSGDLLIVGSGRCVWQDLAQLGASAKSYDVMAINDAIMHVNLPLKHAVSNDAPMLPNWIAARRPYYRSQV